MENFEKIKRKDHRRLKNLDRFAKKRLPRCNGKHSYRTWEEAETVRYRQQEREGIPLYIYKCHRFDFVEVVHWHLTHKNYKK